MNDTVNIKDFKVEAAKRKAKEKIDKAAASAKNLWDNYQAEILGACILFAPMVTTAVRSHERKERLKYERDNKELYIWDPSGGMHWKTRRRRTANENLEIERRVKVNKEPMGEVLRSMKLL